MSDEGLLLHNTLTQIYRLKDIFPHVTIILIIRSHIDLILSRYHQQVKRGMIASTLKKYLRENQRKLIGICSYSILIQFLRALFDDRVHVFLFEEYNENMAFLGQDLGRIILGQEFDSIQYEKNLLNVHQNAYGGKFTNPTFYAMYPFLRRINYFRLSRLGRLRKFRKKTIPALASYVDNVILRWFPDIKKSLMKNQKELVANYLGRFVIDEIKTLEKTLNRKLPPQYYQAVEGN